MNKISRQNSFQILLIILAGISIMAAALYYSRTDSALQERYETVANEMSEKTRTLIAEKKEAILLIALSMGNDSHIRDAIISRQLSQLDLENFSRKFELHTSLKDIWFQIISKDGVSLYRSWTAKHGDKISLKRLDIIAMLKEPDIVSSISTGSFDLTFKAMVPVYDEQQGFIGIFEVIARFNSIAEKLKKEAIHPVFLVDKNYRKQLDKAFSSRFIGDYYVANNNVEESYLKLIETQQVENFINLNNSFQVDQKRRLLVVYFALPDIRQQPMGHFILFKSLDDIYVDDIYSARNQFVISTAIFVILLFFIVRYISNQHITQSIKAINLSLEEKVSIKNKELIEQGRFLQSIMDSVSNAVIVIDKDFNVTMMNKVALANNAYQLQPGEQKKCYQVTHHINEPCALKGYECPHQAVFSSAVKSKVIHEHHGDNGISEYIEITATPLLNAAGEVEAIIELGHDITDHILVNEQLLEQKNYLSHQVHHDALTGLPNRTLFIDRLRQNIKLVKREHSGVAVLFIDLDRFKPINDSLGHSIGDKVLIEVSQRLKNAIREVDTVARMGGDEFTLILTHVKALPMLIEVLHKLLKILAEKMLVDDHELSVSASIGVSLYPDDGQETDVLLRNADAAMYQAKRQGGNNYQFYQREIVSIAEKKQKNPEINVK